MSNVKELLRTLNQYEEVSGQEANLLKSNVVFSSTVNVKDKRPMLLALGMKEMK